MLFSSDLSFNDHIHSIRTKAFKILGFIKRNCKEFNNLW